MIESLVTSVSPLWQSKLYRITSGCILCNSAANVILLATLLEHEHTSENGTMRKGKLLAGQMTRTQTSQYWVSTECQNSPDELQNTL
jgi:hypothetical protein